MLKFATENDADKDSVETLEESMNSYIKALRRCFLARTKYGENSKELKEAEDAAQNEAILIAGKLCYEFHPTRMLDITEAPGMGLDDDVLEEMNASKSYVF